MHNLQEGVEKYHWLLTDEEGYSKIMACSGSLNKTGSMFLQLIMAHETVRKHIKFFEYSKTLVITVVILFEIYLLVAPRALFLNKLLSRQGAKVNEILARI